MSAGVHSTWDIPPDKKLLDAARRQLTALKEERLVVEPTRPPFIIHRHAPGWPGAHSQR